MLEKAVLTAVIVVMISVVPMYAGIPGSLTLNLGGGFSRIDLVKTYAFASDDYQDLLQGANITVFESTNIYSLYGEAVYAINNNLSVGGGIQYMFNGNEITRPTQSFQDDYDNRRPRDEDFPRRTVDIYFIMPYLTSAYEIELLGVGIVPKINIGYGYVAFYDYNSWLGRVKYDSFGYGIIPSISKSFVVSRDLLFNCEFGYKYQKTGKLKNSFGNTNFYNEKIDFSGPFVQSSFSFRL